MFMLGLQIFWVRMDTMIMQTYVMRRYQRRTSIREPLWLGDKPSMGTLGDPDVDNA